MLILLHCIVLIVGGHYTYAEVPLFSPEILGGERNNYDKIGHFMQGLVPAIVAQEILLRLQVVNSKRWMEFFVVLMCLAFSALYEMIEWGVAVLSGTSAEAFLGTHGYVWNTPSDMGWALMGAITAMLCLSCYHDKQLSKLD